MHVYSRNEEEMHVAEPDWQSRAIVEPGDGLKMTGLINTTIRTHVLSAGILFTVALARDLGRSCHSLLPLYK